MMVDFNRIDFCKCHIPNRTGVLNSDDTQDHLEALKNVVLRAYPRPVGSQSFPGWDLGVGLSPNRLEECNVQPELKTTKL